jgi:outer membrane protein insertion porin family
MASVPLALCRSLAVGDCGDGANGGQRTKDKGRRRKVSLLAATLVALAVPALAQDTSRFLDKPIAKVDVVVDGANLAVDDGTLRQTIEQSVRAGQPLAADGVRRAIDRLVSEGLAARVVVDVEPAPDERVSVRFRVTRQVRVAAVRFRGEDALARDALPGRLTAVGVGVKVTDQVLHKGAEEIARYYQERGNFEASVRPSVELDDTGTRATVTFSIAPGLQARVATFDVVGDFVIPAEQIRAATRLRAGALFTQAALDSDVASVRRTLLTAGYLAPTIRKPAVSRNVGANTVAISLRVDSGPKIDVDVQGVDISRKDLETILPIFTEGGLDEYQLSEGVRRLTERLQQDGYFFARVAYAIERSGGGAPDRVLYTVERGRQYEITDIDFEGLTALPEAELLADLKSQEAGSFSRGLTSRDLLQRDSDTIQRRLKALGFREAVVRERRLGVSPDSPSLVITFVVEEGPRSVVDGVVLRGNTIFSADELRVGDDLRPGGFYSDAGVAGDANRVLQKYASVGYMSAEISTQLAELDEHRVRVFFDVTEGRKAYVENVVIGGNTRTRPAILRQYLDFKVGDLLRVESLRKTEQTLFETGAFSQVVIHSDVTGATADGHGEYRTVYVDVTEAKAWVLTYGAGFNSDDGARGLLEISNTNLFGLLNTGSLRLRGSQREQLAQISFTDPLPMGYDFPLLASVFYLRELKDAFGSNRFTGLIQLQTRLDDYTALFFRYNFEKVTLFDVKLPEQQLERNDRPIRLGKLSASYVRDTRDSPFDPSTGAYYSADASVALKALGGNAQFWRLYGEYQRYTKLPKAHQVTYAAVVKFGVEDPFGGESRIPISERFFSGGARTLRGFEFEQAGPRDPVFNNPVGGRVLFVMNNELRFPLVWKFGGAAFSDTGNVFRRFRDVKLRNVSETVGAGLRFQTPVGPVRVDFGYLLNPPPGVPRSAFHFSFGEAF